MNVINKMRNYLLDEEFAIHIYQDRVDVINYTSIGHFDHEKVIIYYDKGELHLKGEKLVVSKLLNDEILVTGKIHALELR